MTERPATLRLETHGGVARIVLDRPDAANTIDLDLAQALQNAARHCAEDSTIRCVLLAGQGRFFCGGGDITAFAAATDFPALLRQLTTHLHAAILSLAHMQKPLVTAINGAAAGAGVSLAMLGDVAIAAASAKFALAYGAIGLTPDGGASWLLPRLVGLRRAQELLLTNRRIGAEEAAAIGLVTRIAPDDAVHEQAMQAAQTLCGAATGALGRTRLLLLGAYQTRLDTQLAEEGDAIVASAAGAEAREGVAAFLARRAPVFGAGGA